MVHESKLKSLVSICTMDKCVRTRAVGIVSDEDFGVWIFRYSIWIESLNAIFSLIKMAYTLLPNSILFPVGLKSLSLDYGHCALSWQ